MSRKNTLSQQDWPEFMASCGESVRHAALARFYRADWPVAETPLEKVQFVALDVETTGLDARRHAIVSIGLIPFTLDRIRSDQAWYQVVRPQTELVPESVTFHHITHSDVRQAPRFGSILEDLLERLAGKVAVVHYRNIERGFLEQATQQVLGESLLFPVIDTMQIEADLHPGREPGWLSRLFGKKPLSIRLADSRTRYGLPLYQAHHALTDALATAELLQAQVATHFSPQLRLGDLWC